MVRVLPFVFALFLSGFPAVLAQVQPPVRGTTKDDDDVLKMGPKDPYTGEDKKLMATAGIVSYGPFPWADFKTTADVDRVLGERRVLWVETAHFRIGLNLKTVSWPESSDQRKALQEEIKQLHKLLPKLPERPKKIDPWIRMHLYVQRLEACYADFEKLIGATDSDFPAKGKTPGEGAFLGMPDKYLVLLFQKKSDLARYGDRFCGSKEDTSMRHYHDQTHQMLFGAAAEGLEGFNEAGLHGHVIYGVMHNLVNGYQGFSYLLPLWFDEGLAHYYSRKVESDVINVQILDTEAVAEDKQNNWPVKVRRRAQHEGAYIPFEKMAKWEKFDEMGYHAHSQAWSRVDYLMQLSPEKVGQMLKQLKSLTAPMEGMPPVTLANMAQKLLIELFDLDAATYDQKWREWVLKTYPSK
jgi:hypothetical protein